MVYFSFLVRFFGKSRELVIFKTFSVTERIFLCNDISERVSATDVIYQDVAQKNQVEIFLKNVNIFLKNGGYGMLALKARSIDVTKNPKQIFREVKEKLEKFLTIIDYRELDPFQKDHCMFICKKK